ncbi:MAG: hypothetical protein EXR71_01170 [Myxococcales bacterium]|nr:hypothetical protein [Myxococcales bacterium]
MLVEIPRGRYRGALMECLMRLLPYPCLVVALAACTGDSGTDEDGTDPGTETGDTDIDWGPPGCINLNAVEGDFTTIGEAANAALVGDVINVCAGSYSEKVTVPEGVSVAGAASGSTLIDAPVNEVAFDIAGAGSGVSGFTITSTRSGITLDGAVRATISDIVFDAPANYGIESVNSTDVAISNCTFLLPAFGGIYISGGTATVDASLFSEPSSFGVWAASGAVVTVSNNLFGVVYATTTDGSDGIAVFSDEATVAMSNNVITASEFAGVLANKGSLSIAGDVITDTPYGIIADGGDFSANGLEVYGATQVGVLVNTKADVVISNATILLNGGDTTGLTSCSEDYANFTGNCGGGLFLQADAATVTGVTVADYENYGVFLASARNNGTVTGSLQDVTIDNTGRWGLYANAFEGTVDRLVVTNHREPDLTNTSICYSVDRAGAAVFYDSAVTLTNSAFNASEGWGVAIVFGTVDVSTTDFQNAECAGIVNYQAVSTMSGNTFGPNGQHGGIFSYEAASVVDGNTFVDTAHDAEYLYDDGAGGFNKYVYSGYGKDALFYSSTACLVTNNTFTGGDTSLDFEVTGCTVTGNTWTNYNGTVISVYEGDPSDPVVISGNTADQIGGTVVDSVYGHAEVEDLQVGTTVAYSYTYASYAVAADGTETESYSYSYSYGQPVFRAYGYYSAYWSDADGDGVNDTFTEYGYPSGMTINNVRVEEAYDTLLEGSEAALEVTDLTAGNVAGYGIYATWSHYAPEVELDGVEIASVLYSGIHLAGNTQEAGYASVSDVSLDQVGIGAGVWITGFAEWTLEDVTILDSAGYGVYSTGDYSYYDYETSTSVYGTIEPVSELFGVVIGAATLDGISITNGTPIIDRSEASDGAASGLVLTGTTAEVVDSVFTVNGEYGMECVTTILATCSGNVIDSNLSGPHLDCTDDCML